MMAQLSRVSYLRHVIITCVDNYRFELLPFLFNFFISLWVSLNPYWSHPTTTTGLGLAYAGTRRQDVVSLLLPVLSDRKSSPEVVALAALACGLITVGAADSEVLSSVLQTLLDLPVSELQEGQYSRFLPLALGLCYLGWYWRVFFGNVFC